MELKNWALSLFQPGAALFEQGFSNAMPTPIIDVPHGILTPDVIAWGKSIFLVVEGKSGQPDSQDVAKMKKYLKIPYESIRSLTQMQRFTVEGVLLYFEDRFDSNVLAKEDILGKVSLERNMMIWVCTEGIRIRLVAGSHSDSVLQSILSAGLPISRYPFPQIEVELDSPLILVARTLFKRLWETACRTKDTLFDINLAKIILRDQNYARDDSEETVKVERAIEIGLRESLCLEEQSGRLWRLDLFPDSPVSIKRYLDKLDKLLIISRITNYLG
jgi:hypothetical protein